MLKIRRPLGRLIFNMGIAIPGKTVFLIETAPGFNKFRRRHFQRHCLEWSYLYFSLNFTGSCSCRSNWRADIKASVHKAATCIWDIGIDKYVVFVSWRTNIFCWWENTTEITKKFCVVRASIEPWTSHTMTARAPYTQPTTSYRLNPWVFDTIYEWRPSDWHSWFEEGRKMYPALIFESSFANWNWTFRWLVCKVRIDKLYHSHIWIP